MAMGEEWLLDGHLNLGQSIVRSSSAALEDALVAGKGLGEDVMKPSRRRQGRKSKGGESRKEGEGGRKQR